MTLSGFVALIAALSVVGVKRRLTAPPSRINAGDLPLSYPRIPQQSAVPVTFAANGHSATLELAVVVAPDDLDTKGANFALACALADALNGALAGAGNTIDAWGIRQTYEQYGGDGGTGYMVLVATVDGSW